MPDLPTMAEAGVPGYDFTAGRASRRRPARRADHQTSVRSDCPDPRDPEAREWFESFGAEPGGEPPDVFAALVRAEHASWAT